MKKLTAMLLCIVLVLSLATVAFAAEPATEILKGAPVVDGKMDALYEGSYTVTVDKSSVIWVPKEDTDDVKTTVRFLHDGEYLYVCAIVTGDSAIVDTGAASWACDGIDVWFMTPEANVRSKITLDAFAQPYDEDNKYIGAYENGLNIDLSKVEKAAIRDEANKSYVVEAKIPVPFYSESEGTIGINIQLNNVYDPTDIGDGSKNGGFYGAQYNNPVIVALSDIAAVEPQPAPEILKGTPVVDGKLDGLYKGSLSIVQGKEPAIWVPKEDPDNVEATVYFLHEGEYLYVCAVVTGDSTIVDTGAVGWACDGIDVWFLTPEANVRSKITLDAFAQPYDEDNKYIGNFENGLNVDLTKIEKAAVRDEANNTYVVEAKIPVPYYSESEGTIGINIQLNNVYDADANTDTGNKKGGFYGAQYNNPVVIALSNTAAKAPAGSDETGDAISLVIAMLAVSALGITVMKKKEF